MAEKKYLSFEKLSLYDEKIKKVISDGDAAALASAKEYANGLAVNYDAAGTAKTKADEALAAAKLYADGKDEAIAAAKTQADKGVTDAATADGKAVKAQEDVDALKTYVGTIPTDAGVASVVAYVEKKTEGIASDSALTELSDRVTTAEGEIAAVKADYLKGDDKTELEGKITAAQDAVEAAQGEIDALELKVGTVTEGKTVVQMIEDAQAAATYDDTQIKADIQVNENAIAKLNDSATVEGSVDYKIAQAVSAIMENPDETMNSIQELVTWVNEHAEDALALSNQVTQDGKDIDALEALVGSTAVATQITDAIASALKIEGVDKYALATDLTAAIARIAVIEGKAHEHANKDLLDTYTQTETDLADAVAKKHEHANAEVLNGITSEKVAAWDNIAANAATDAQAKADKALEDAKDYADGLNTTMDNRVKDLEAIDHDHANKAELDLIAVGDKAKWDVAAGKTHEHSNFDVLEAITAAQVQAWNAAEQAAKTYADGLNTAMDTRMVAVENWQKNMVEISETDINSLFA